MNEVNEEKKLLAGFQFFFHSSLVFHKLQSSHRQKNGRVRRNDENCFMFSREIERVGCYGSNMKQLQVVNCQQQFGSLQQIYTCGIIFSIYFVSLFLDVTFCQSRSKLLELFYGNEGTELILKDGENNKHFL